MLFSFLSGGFVRNYYDVAIVGAGPAGSTAAAQLVRAGRSVVLFVPASFFLLSKYDSIQFVRDRAIMYNIQYGEFQRRITLVTKRFR